MNISTIDLIVFIAYCLLILLVGLFVSRRGKGETQDASNYFLAGRGLAWWAIGASIIASNISAEQFVGMSGSGYAIGLAMATYEWIAALGLLIVAKFFIPIFLEKKIFTMPQFLDPRQHRHFQSSRCWKTRLRQRRGSHRGSHQLWRQPGRRWGTEQWSPGR